MKNFEKYIAFNNYDNVTCEITFVMKKVWWKNEEIIEETVG